MKKFLLIFVMFLVYSISAKSQSFIVISPVTDFGSHYGGVTISKTFTVKNNSGSQFLLNVPGWSASYITSVSPRTTVISPYGMQTFTVTVKYPVQISDYSSYIQISYSNTSASGFVSPIPIIKLKTIAQAPIPAAPTNVHITNITSNTCWLAWDPSYGATEYHVNWLNNISSTAYPSNYIWGLSPNTTYTIKVYASSGGHYSQPATFTFTTP